MCKQVFPPKADLLMYNTLLVDTAKWNENKQSARNEKSREVINCDLDGI